MGLFVKDPAAAIDHVIDWDAGYLGARSIAQSEWLAAPAVPGGIAITAPRIDGGRTVATLAGGLAGHVYRITNRVVLSDGARDERSLIVRVEER